MYEHVVAKRKVYIGGALAFDVGHRIPIDTARRLGLVEEDTPVVPSTDAPRTDFVDAALHVSTTTDGAAGVSTEAPNTDSSGTDTGAKTRS